MKNFWNDLPKPFFVLAPMADVTDVAFRTLIAKYSAHERKDGTVGGPDVMWTEFVSADGLALAPEEGRRKLLVDLEYTEAERPIVAQLFSAVPEHMEAAAALCKDVGFDGVDVNMGCPDRSIEKQGCGSAMIKNPESAIAVIEAAKRGASGLPVSVKTRLGYNTDELEEWLPKLLSAEPALITLHARTRKEMSKVPARWERVGRAVEIRDALGSETWIAGNGDVVDLEDAHAKAELSRADGVMLGRAIFGNPWLFHPSKSLFEHRALSASSSLDHRSENYDSLRDSSIPRSASHPDPLSITNDIVTVEERLNVMLEHTRLFEELLSEKNFSIMKKHYKAYVTGFLGAKELRVALMDATNADEVEKVVHTFLHETSRQTLTSSATL